VMKLFELFTKNAAGDLDFSIAYKATSSTQEGATPPTPGTGNTTGTVNQIYGRTITAGFTGFYNSTSEPTVLTAFDSFLLTPVGGLLLYDYPLGDTPDTAVSNGIVLRCTAPATVNVRASFAFERC